MSLFAFNNAVSPMLMKKSLKAFAISLGSEIIVTTCRNSRVLQGQVESYRTLAIRCNNRMDEYETVLQQHTNALRDLSERPIAPKNAVTNDDEIPDKDDGTKNESNVTTSTRYVFISS